MLGQQVSDHCVPDFFTDQYDRGVEFVGWLPRGGDGRHHKDLTPKR